MTVILIHVLQYEQFYLNKKAYIQAGAGIVYDSVPEKEFCETQNKAKAMINAIEEATAL